MLPRTIPAGRAVLMVVLLATLTRSASADTPGSPSGGPVASPYQPVPAGYHMESRPSPWLVIPGAIVLGVAYSGSVASAISSRCSNNRWMAVPLAGPFITAAKYDANYQGACDDPETIHQALATWDGIFQGAGALLLVGGLLFPTHQAVRNDETAGTLRRGATAVSWHVAPLPLGKTGGGVGVLGTF